MREYLPLLAMGVLLTAAGIPDLLWRPALLQRRSRRRVREEDVPAYSRVMGIGCVIIGVSVMVSAVLLMIFDREALFWLTAIGCAGGGGACRNPLRPASV